MTILTDTNKPFLTSTERLNTAIGRSVMARLVLFGIGFTTFLNLYVTQPLLPRFREMFHATELMVSLTVSGPVLAVALAAPLLGLLADTLGRKRVICIAMLCLSLPTFMVATAETLPALIFWRILQGLFIPGIITVTMAYISEEAPDSAVGSIMATYVTGTVVGGFAGRFVAGICATHYDWRMAFVLFGLFTLVSAFAVLWLLPRSCNFVRQRGGAASFSSLRIHLRNRRLLATYAIGFNVLFCLVAAFTYVNFHLADKPFYLSPAALGSIFTVYLIGAVITPIAGALLDRIGSRRTLTMAVGVIVCGLLLTLLRSVPAIITGLTLASTGVFVCQSTASSYVGKVAGRARSSAAGLYVSLYYLGGSVGSILPGIFWQQAGWVGCVAIILCLQAVILVIANCWWQDE